MIIDTRCSPQNVIEDSAVWIHRQTDWWLKFLNCKLEWMYDFDTYIPPNIRLNNLISKQFTHNMQIFPIPTHLDMGSPLPLFFFFFWYIFFLLWMNMYMHVCRGNPNLSWKKELTRLVKANNINHLHYVLNR